MKRSALITLGAMIILLMVVMWVYLLIYGTPKQANDVFTNLGVSTNNGAVRVMDVQSTISTSTSNTSLPVSQSTLQQLTQRPIAGFSFIVNDPPSIVYMEKGTGHVYKINTKEGTEVLLSALTIAGAQSAVFAPDATAFAVTTYSGRFAKSSFGEISGETDTKLYPLLINARNITFKDSATVLFTTEEAGATVAYSFKRATMTQSKLFSIPFIDARMYWGSEVVGVYAQTKPSALLIGYVYKVSATGVLTTLPETGLGLTLIPTDTQYVTSQVTQNTYTSNLSGVNIRKQPFAMFSEKCAFEPIRKDVIWCAAPLTPVANTSLEAWYKGTITSEDYLWQTNVQAQSATLVGDLKKLSGTNIDVTGMKINSTGATLIFENKIDDTLWMYQIQQR